MALLDTLVDQDTSAAFEVTSLDSDRPINITTIGTYNSQTITMQVSMDRTNYVDLYDGATVTFTVTGQQKTMVLQPGQYRFTSSSGLTSVAIYVAGKSVRLL